jgi:hypothetical protein
MLVSTVSGVVTAGGIAGTLWGTASCEVQQRQHGVSHCCGRSSPRPTAEPTEAHAALPPRAISFVQGCSEIGRQLPIRRYAISAEMRNLDFAPFSGSHAALPKVWFGSRAVILVVSKTSRLFPRQETSSRLVRFVAMGQKTTSRTRPLLTPSEYYHSCWPAAPGGQSISSLLWGRSGKG